MHVVIHHHECVDGHVVQRAGLAQQPTVMVSVLIVEEDGSAVYAALGHVQRLVGQDKSGAAGHGKSSGLEEHQACGHAVLP